MLYPILPWACCAQLQSILPCGTPETVKITQPPANLPHCHSSQTPSGSHRPAMTERHYYVRSACCCFDWMAHQCPHTKHASGIGQQCYVGREQGVPAKHRRHCNLQRTTLVVLIARTTPAAAAHTRHIHACATTSILASRQVVGVALRCWCCLPCTQPPATPSCREPQVRYWQVSTKPVVGLERRQSTHLAARVPSLSFPTYQLSMQAPHHPRPSGVMVGSTMQASSLSLTSGA